MPLIRAELLRKHRLGSPVLIHDPSLVGYWPFDYDDGSYARDRSGHVIHGTIYGASKVPGKIGGALSFDGVDDYVNAPTIPTPSGFTMLCWFKRLGNSGGTGSDIAHYLIGGVNGNRENRIQVTKTGDSVVAVVYVDETLYVSSKSIATPAAWHHVASVWDGLKVYVVLDGVFAPGTDAAGVLETGSELTSIGRMLLNWYYANGIIDEVRIYNRALSAAEIVRVMNLRGI